MKLYLVNEMYIKKFELVKSCVYFSKKYSPTLKFISRVYSQSASKNNNHGKKVAVGLRYIIFRFPILC